MTYREYFVEQFYGSFVRKFFPEREVQPNSIIPVKCENDVNEISKCDFLRHDISTLQGVGSYSGEGKHSCH
jgi:hypothetical protein